MTLSPGADGHFTLDVPSSWFAYAMTSHSGIDHGNNVQISAKKPIQLDKSNVKFEINEGVPNLGADKSDSYPRGGPAFFRIETDSNFSMNDSRRGQNRDLRFSFC